MGEFSESPEKVRMPKKPGGSCLEGNSPGLRESLSYKQSSKQISCHVEYFVIAGDFIAVLI